MLNGVFLPASRCQNRWEGDELGIFSDFQDYGALLAAHHALGRSHGTNYLVVIEVLERPVIYPFGSSPMAIFED
jgi:hypothetical protein